MMNAERPFSKTLDSLPDVFAFLSESAKVMGLSAELIPMLHLAIEEVFVNLVRYNTESSNDVRVQFSVDDRTLTIRLVDHDVNGYDLTRHAAVETERPAHERRPGGLGIHFVRQIMDDVSYEYENRTSTITLIKRLGVSDVEG